MNCQAPPKILFATNGRISQIVQMTGKFHQIKIQKTMKKISLEMLRLGSDVVLERSQMKKVLGGQNWHRQCGGGPIFTLWDDSPDPTEVCGNQSGWCRPAPQA
jgi:natural product precursor